MNDPRSFLDRDPLIRRNALHYFFRAVRPPDIYSLDRGGVAKTKVTPKVRLRREARSASYFIHKAQSFGFDNYSSANRASI